MWLSNKYSKGIAFNMIIDGANVGYYKQNFAGAPTHVDYRQIDQIIRHLQGLGFTPILILHCRHLSADMVPTDAVPIVEDWKTKDLLFVTPKGFNDDWFWLYAAVTYKARVITNDEMRDHHFQMLSPKWFPRWKERNQVHFSFNGWSKMLSFRDYPLQCVSTDPTTILSESKMIVDELNPIFPQITKNSSVVSKSILSSQQGVIQPQSNHNTTHETEAKNDEFDKEDKKSAAVVTKPLFSETKDMVSSTSSDYSMTFTREITLNFPLHYSHRMQYIKSEHNIGFYIPLQNYSEDIMNDTSDWLCIYIPIKPNSAEEWLTNQINVFDGIKEQMISKQISNSNLSNSHEDIVEDADANNKMPSPSNNISSSDESRKRCFNHKNENNLVGENADGKSEMIIKKKK